MSKKESYRRTIYPNSRIIYHGRTKKEIGAWRTYQEMQDRERELGEETNPRMELNKEKIQKKGKRRGKCKTSG